MCFDVLRDPYTDIYYEQPELFVMASLSYSILFVRCRQFSLIYDLYYLNTIKYNKYIVIN